MSTPGAGGAVVRLVPGPRWPDVPGWAVGVVGVWLGLVGVLARLQPEPEMTLCTFRRLTGVPCPTCGSTRAVLAAGQGRFLEALLHNPFLAVATVAGLAWLVTRLVLGRTARLDLTRPQRRVVWTMIAVLFALNWGYLIIRELS